MSDKLIEEARAKFEKVMVVVGEDMATVRVGGAKPAMVENILIEVYGQKMKLVELATIAAPDSAQIVISPWDKNIIKEIEKGITGSGLGLVPNVSGEIIRIVVPPLTEERRRDFVTLVRQKLESGKVMLRQVRQEVKEEIDEREGISGVSEDDIKRMLEELQRQVDEYNGRLEAMAQAKEKEIMSM